MYIPNENVNIKDTKFLGYWNHTVPVYHILSIHGLNQIIGHIKHNNGSEGTVLYRGQAQLYDQLIPSILHEISPKGKDDELKRRKKELEKFIDNIIQDEKMRKALHFDETVKNREFYKRYVIESMLQHYGVHTRFQDFVDNHWTALWFGLYELEKRHVGTIDTKNYYKYIYKRRKGILSKKQQHPKSLTLKIPQYHCLPPKPILEDILDKKKYTESWFNANIIGYRKVISQFHQIEDVNRQQDAFQNFVSRHIKKVDKKNKERLMNYDQKKLTIEKKNKILQQNFIENLISDTAYVYILMYLADTKGEDFRGVYAGTETITIDLRKALPSTFLRPSAQHGWTVRRIGDNSDLSGGVVCVLRIAVDLVDKMLGNGLLVQPENFFPSEKQDFGYNILLQREAISPFDTRSKEKFERYRPDLFPYGTIQRFL